MIRVSAFTLLLFVCSMQCVCGQSFQPRAARPTPRANAQQSSGVSTDLLELYSKTKSVTDETSVTAIARACSRVVPDESRTKQDREYAASLLAWALNRRGEMRSESAASMVAKGLVKEAANLDALAADDFATAVEYAPENWRNRHNLAIALAMKGEYESATKQLSKTIELKPDYANAYFNRAELHFELGQYREATRDYSSAIELSPTDPQYFNSRGHCQFMLEAYDQALSDYRRATDLAGDSAVYQTDLADALQYLGRWEEAATEYRAAVAVNNKFPRAYQNAAWLMATCPDSKLRNVDLALSAAKKAIELGTGRTPQTLDTLAAATAASGKYNDAAKLLRQAISMSTDTEEREELTGRLRLYEKGMAYLQPDSNSGGQIRTASSTAKQP